MTNKKAPPVRYGRKQSEVTLAVGISENLNKRINRIVQSLDVPSRSHWLREELEMMVDSYEQQAAQERAARKEERSNAES